MLDYDCEGQGTRFQGWKCLYSLASCQVASSVSPRATCLTFVRTHCIVSVTFKFQGNHQMPWLESAGFDTSISAYIGK